MRKDWVECKLEELVYYSKGKKPTKLFNEKLEGRLPYINIKAFEKNIIDEYSDDEKVNFCIDGDVLMVWDGARAGFSGKSKGGIVGSTLMKIIPVKHLNNNFLFYYLQSLYKFLNTNTKGVGIPHVEPNLLWKRNVFLPPLPEQRAIVKKIEALFSSLDAGISELKKTQQQLQIYRQSVLKKAFEGEKKFISLEKVSEAIGGFAFKSGDFLNDGKYQVIRIGNIRPDLIRLNTNSVFINKLTEKNSKYLLELNDCIISLTGTRNKRDYGFTALVKNENLLLNQRLAAIRFSEEVLPKYFLYFSFTDYFKDQFFASETGNTGQGNVGMNAIKSTLIPFPSLSEQHQIVREIESRLSVCDTVEQQIKDSLAQSEALRQSILKKAFEGKLLTEAELAQCTKEKDYEPASVLLERIKAEKEKKK